MINLQNILTAVALLSVAVTPAADLFAQGQPNGRRTEVAVAFWNVENLFDYARDPRVLDGDFTPRGANRWTPDRYHAKLDNVARTIARLAPGTPDGGDYGNGHGGLAVIGLAEVENGGVLQDLVRRPALVRHGYAVVHRDSPDRRGIDVALLYRPALFTPDTVRTYRFRLPADTAYRTRDQLLVSGRLLGERVHFVVCHWPSRYGGRRSERLRMHAAAITRRIVDSLAAFEPGARVVVMGDMNDNPDDRSLRLGLGAAPTVEQALSTAADPAARNEQRAVLFNATWELWRRGVGTLAFLGRWQLFDQIIVSAPLLRGYGEDGDGSGYAGQDSLRAVIARSVTTKQPTPSRAYGSLLTMPRHEGGRRSQSRKRDWAASSLAVTPRRQIASGQKAPRNDDGGGLRFEGVEVFARPWLLEDEGRGKGAPRRTFRDGAFDPDGASDHLPVVVRFTVGR